MSNEDISELSSNSCSNKARELKSLLSTGGCGGRMEKIMSDDWDFFSKSPFDCTKGVDVKSECQTFNVDDNIVININNLQKSISDAYCCKIYTKNEIEKKFLNFMYLEKYKEELLQTSLKRQ